MRLYLSTTSLTWVLFAGTVLLWLFSLKLIKRHAQFKNLGLKVIMLSFFGYAWIGFGVDFILRFLALAYDPYLFRATNFPFWLLNANVLTWTWIYLLIFWMMFSAGYACVIHFMQGGVPNILKRLDLFGSFQQLKIKVLDAIFILSLIAIVMVNSSVFPVPRSLLTPIGYLSSFYILPVTVSWVLYFRGFPIKSRRFIYMFAGLLLYGLSPYKEHLISLFISVLIPAIVFSKNISYKKLLISTTAILLFAFLITASYREIKWGESQHLAEKPIWVKISRRFHGFDSMALTVFAIPNIFPYTERNIIEDLVVRIIPRAFLLTKKNEHRGRIFSTTIWALKESEGIVKRTSAPIAPSMSGDLYSTHGLLSLALGALFFGGVVGFLERWNWRLGPAGSCILIALFGIRIAGGLERDFVFTISNITQMIIVMLLIAAFFPFRAKTSNL